MNKRFLLSCSVATLGLVVIGFYSYNTHNNNQANLPTNVTEKVELPNSTMSSKQQTSNLDAPPPSKKNALLADDNKASYDIWSSNKGDHRTVPSQYSSFKDDGVDRAYLKIKRLEIASLNSGNRFAVDIPQTNNVFEAVVDNINYHSNGDKSVTATIDNGNNEPYTVTITQGENATFGTFSTPDGVYILEADTTDGWLASKNDLISIQDRTVSDEVHITPDNSDLPPSS